MCDDRLQEDNKKQCAHNPGRSFRPFSRFLTYFWNRNKLMDTYTYTAVCPHCREFLCVPKIFLSTELKCFLGLVSAILEIILILLATCGKDPLKHFIIGQFFVAVLTFIMVRSITTAILTFGKWKEQQPMNDVLLRYYNDPTGHNQRTYIVIMVCLAMAMMITFGYYGYILLGALLAIFNILIGIIAKEKVNLKLGLFVILGVLIILISGSFSRSNILTYIIAGIGFLICFIALYFIIKYLDNRKNRISYGI